MQWLVYGFCIAALAAICRLWVRRDHREIQQATGKHELKKKFHRQGLVWKMLSVLPLPVLFAAFFQGWCIFNAFVSFSVFAASYWWYAFDLGLNKARNLDPYYIGKSSDLDKLLQWIADELQANSKWVVTRVKVPLLAIAFLLCIAVIVSC